MSDFVTYLRFHTPEEAGPILHLLDDWGIEYKVESEKNVLDNIYLGDSLDPLITLKIPSSAFEKVNGILEKSADTDKSRLNPDYYLLRFSNEELIDVVHHPGEWNYFDTALAKKLLAERNIPVPSADILSSRDHYTPLRLAPVWIVMEVLLSIFFSYAGIIIGVATLVATKTLPSGEKVYIYDEVTRRNAKIIIVIGIIVTAYYFYSVLS
jgi:hypothetical protein